MFYSKEEKELLGRYFKYYREKQQIAFSDVIKSGICDYKTYKGIEEGIAKPSNLFYDELLNYYKLDGSILSLYSTLNPLLDELYDACEWYDNERIKMTIDTIESQVKHYSYHPLITELIKSLEIIKKLHIFNEYLNEKEIYETFNLIELWNNKISSLLIEVCGVSNTNTAFSYDIPYKLSNYVNKNESITKFWYAKICINKANYVEALEIFNDLELEYQNRCNKIRYLKVIQSKQVIYRDIDDKKADEYTIKLIKYLEDGNIHSFIKAPIYYSIAIYYYLNSRYIEALSCFEEHYKIKNTDNSLLFICACKSRLKKLFDCKIKENINGTLFPYIHYYYLKSNNENPKDLENYIINQLIPILMNDKYEYPLWNMFNYEMSELVKTTRNYKKYHIYNENFQKATKTAL